MPAEPPNVLKNSKWKRDETLRRARSRLEEAHLAVRPAEGIVQLRIRRNCRHGGGNLRRGGQPEN